jgi:hypothetical protein
MGEAETASFLSSLAGHGSGFFFRHLHLRSQSQW